MVSSLNIFKASAGSGKTFTLTIEYIYLMVRPQKVGPLPHLQADDEYMHTLAVTFTNKATAEMKNRILQHLYGISNAIPSSDNYVGKILEKLKNNGVNMTINDLRERCGRALSMILHDYNRFRVETIDSFFHSVLKTLAHELGQSSKLQVDLNDDELLDIAVDRMIDNLDLDKELRTMVLQYVEDEMEENGRWNIKGSLKDFAKCIFKEDFMSRSVKEKETISNVENVRKFRSTMKDIMEQSELKIIEAAEKLLSVSQHICTPQFIGAKNPIKTYLQSFIDGSKEDKMGKTLTMFQSDATRLLLNKMKNDTEAISLMEELQTGFNAFVELKNNEIKKYNTASLARKYTNQLQLLSKIDNIVRNINEERESFPLSRTPTLLSQLIDGQDNPFIFEKIGVVLRNIMIDEFQDTSRLQWENFRVLLFENQSLGGTDLIVGDIKQSIYRWRGGEWSLLNNLSQTMSTWCPNTNTLDTNYRSEKNIIDFNNEVFPKAALELDKISPTSKFRIGGKEGIYSDVYQHTSPQKANTPKGYCNISVRIKANKENGYEKLTTEEYHEWVYEEMLEHIETLYQQGLPLNKMAILLRYNAEANNILKYFEKHAPQHIRIASDEAYILGNSSIVIIIISAMRTLISDYKDKPIAYHLFLMHYIYRVQKCDSATLDSILRCNALEKMPDFLIAERTKLKQMPLYELVEELYIRLNLQSLIGQEAYHYAFLDEVRLYLQDNPNDLHSFLEIWDNSLSKKAIPSGKQDGIRILSIHKSKGLEFHTVLLPHCDWKLEKDKGDIIWCEAENDHTEYNVLGPMPISKHKSMGLSYYSGRYEEENQHSRVDELNSLYVALTRASCNMYIWSVGTDKSIVDDHCIANLLRVSLPKETIQDNDILRYANGTPITTVKEDEASDNRMQPDHEAMPIKMSSYKARLNFRQSNESKGLFGENDEARAQGTLYHNVLAQIKDNTQIEQVLKKNRMQCVITNEQYEELSAMLIQIKEVPLIASWFAPDNFVFAECEILDPTAKRKNKRDQRPDRIVMNDKHITVIDYKFGEEHGAYSTQVSNYKRLLRQLYPDYTVDGYLWYVKNGNIEKI